jgi:dynein heavy chain 1
VDKKRSDLLKL